MHATQDYFEAKIASLEAAIQRVRELHTMRGKGDGTYCGGCRNFWPCSTIAALDGSHE